jgi:hypothetical protein
LKPDCAGGKLEPFETSAVSLSMRHCWFREAGARAMASACDPLRF